MITQVNVLEPAISVAIASYNGGDNLAIQLQSLADQSFLPIEVIITDDGSTDNTVEVVQRFAETARFPVTLHKNSRRLGFADNFLHAASLCRGEWIAFCDQDDVWRSNKLARCAELLADTEVLVCSHTGDVWDGSEINGQKYPDFDTTQVHSVATLNPLALVPGFAILVRSALLESVQGVSRPRNIFTRNAGHGRMAHDQWAWFLGTILGKVATVADGLVLYRQHSSNTLGAPQRTNQIASILQSLREGSYTTLSEVELDCANVARHLSNHARLSPEHRANALRAADLFEMRARFHQLRGAIYSDGSHIFSRVLAFQRILMANGYRNDSAANCLGRKAFLKDLAFGLPGFYKIAKG